MIFSGVIDRIDTYEDEENIYVKVVDYKTGGIKLSLNSVFYGLQMQLVLYMAAAMDIEKRDNGEKNIVPAGMFYYYVKDPVLKFDHFDEDEDLEEQMLGEYRCSGYASERTEVLQKLDSVFGTNGYLENGAKSSCVPVNVTSKGDFGRYAKVLSDEKWEKAITHTTRKAAEFGRDIMRGKIDISPYHLGKETGCDYCGLRGICGMERTEFASRCRQMEEKEEEDIWEDMGKKEGEQR